MKTSCNPIIITFTHCNRFGLSAADRLKVQLDVMNVGGGRAATQLLHHDDEHIGMFGFKLHPQDNLTIFSMQNQRIRYLCNKQLQILQISNLKYTYCGHISKLALSFPFLQRIPLGKSRQTDLDVHQDCFVSQASAMAQLNSTEMVG